MSDLDASSFPADTPHSPDEGWWESVLVEMENRFDDEEEEPFCEEIDWMRIQQLYEQEMVINLPVVSFNRGGLLVGRGGIKGFLPVSHLVKMYDYENDNGEREDLLSSFLGKMLCLKVIECDPKRERVVFSERAAMSEPGCRKKLLKSLRVGEKVQGTVTNVTDFGVFVDLGGLEGLIHISELSWGRVRHPCDILDVGDTVIVSVLGVDHKRGRVPLSRKRLLPNPWENVGMLYQPGQITGAVITSLVPFGAFASLESGVEGLIHVSQMGFPSDIQHESVLEEGQHVIVEILSVEPERHRLGLRLLNWMADKATVSESEVFGGEGV
ncbi:MAG: S1 RNA-binding domain-containing protein [Chloroflexota bacterium]